MRRRLFLAVSAGAVAFLRTAEELWYRTNMELPEIVFWAMTAYVVGIIVTYAVSDKFRIKRVPARKDPVLITLDREEWERGEETKYPA